jgi:hypothetical protein
VTNSLAYNFHAGASFIVHVLGGVFGNLEQFEKLIEVKSKHYCFSQLKFSLFATRKFGLLSSLNSKLLVCIVFSLLSETTVFV